MQNFPNASNFVVENINAVDTTNIYQGEAEFNRLVNAACLGAGHQSAERSDAPKCHPKTREAVISDIMSWVTLKDTQKRIMWLNGPAGAGKSSIAQTIAEMCHNDNRLIASFFFSRTAIGTGRDDGNKLVPTISYQLTIAIPATKDIIIAQLDRDKATLTYSMEVQIQKLVVEPLAQVLAQSSRNNSDLVAESQLDATVPSDKSNNSLAPIPELVIIDGLDECNSSSMQSQIIEVIAKTLLQSPVHFQFLIASRPELEIRTAFNSVEGYFTRLTLDNSYRPDKDIRTYLKSEFTTLKRKHILTVHLCKDSSWPSDQDIDTLVERSSGQFIYASTVIKFIKNHRRDPRERLHAIIDTQLEGAGKESPYEQLDNLYHFVLSNAVDKAEGIYDNSILIVFQVLLFMATHDWLVKSIGSVRNLSDFIKMQQTDVELLVADLHSLIYINDDGYMSFFHASFGDFLKDFSRSGKFFVDAVKAHKALGHYCLANLYGVSAARKDVLTVYSLHYFLHHFKRSGFDDVLLEELRGRVDLRSILRETIREMSISSALSTVINDFFKIDFSFEEINDFSLPATEKIQDICACISEVIDDFFLSWLGSSSDEKWLILSSIISLNDAMTPGRTRYLDECWLAKLLLSPQRSKQHFLSSEQCLDLCCCALGKLRSTLIRRCNDYSPFVIEFLLKRITCPKKEFQEILQQFVRTFEDFIYCPDSCIYITSEQSEGDVLHEAKTLKEYILAYLQDHSFTDETPIKDCTTQNPEDPSEAPESTQISLHMGPDEDAPAENRAIREEGRNMEKEEDNRQSSAKRWSCSGILKWFMEKCQSKRLRAKRK